MAFSLACTLDFLNNLQRMFQTHWALLLLAWVLFWFNIQFIVSVKFSLGWIDNAACAELVYGVLTISKVPLASLFTLNLISVFYGLVGLLDLAGVFHLIELILLIIWRVLSRPIILMLLALRFVLFGGLRSLGLSFGIHSVSRFRHRFNLWLANPVCTIFALRLRNDACLNRHHKSLFSGLKRRSLHIQRKNVILVCHLSPGRNFDKNKFN